MKTCKSAPQQSRSHSRSSPTPTTLLLKTSTARLDTPDHQTTPDHAQHTSSQTQPGSSARAPGLEPVLHTTRAPAQSASSKPATPALSSIDPGTTEHWQWHTDVVPAALESRSRRTSSSQEYSQDCLQDALMRRCFKRSRIHPPCILRHKL